MPNVWFNSEKSFQGSRNVGYEAGRKKYLENLKDFHEKLKKHDKPYKITEDYIFKQWPIPNFLIYSPLNRASILEQYESLSIPFYYFNICHNRLFQSNGKRIAIPRETTESELVAIKDELEKLRKTMDNFLENSKISGKLRIAKPESYSSTETYDFFPFAPLGYIQAKVQKIKHNPSLNRKILQDTKKELEEYLAVTMEEPLYKIKLDPPLAETDRKNLPVFKIRKWW